MGKIDEQVVYPNGFGFIISYLGYVFRYTVCCEMTVVGGFGWFDCCFDWWLAVSVGGLALSTDGLALSADGLALSVNWLALYVYFSLVKVCTFD
jgi:hypothetical protein